MVAPLKISSFSDAELVQKYRELWYRSVECAIVPDHPQTKKNGSRWARELRQVERACESRGLFQEDAE